MKNEETAETPYEKAISVSLKHTMAKWPKCDPATERVALMKAYPTLGLAQNHAAYAAGGEPNEDLVAQAKTSLTESDWQHLRQGG